MSLLSRTRHQLIFLLLTVFLAACSSLDPAALPSEYTEPAVDAPLWNELAQLREGNWQQPLSNGPNALDWRLRAIDAATSSIELQTFLWTFDITGALMIDHLMAAAERGVRVKLLIDDSFLPGEDAVFLAMAEHPNIEYRIFNPFQRRTNNVITRQLLNLAEFSRLDHRMHNKAMIVDSQIAIVGGRNLADEYFGLLDGPNFRDMELLVGGPVVGDIAAAFDQYWNDRWSVPIEDISHVRHEAADLERARQMKDESLHVHEEQGVAEMRAEWRQAVLTAYDGDIELYFDTPPQENPADESSAPVQLARDLESLLDSAREEILIVSAYLIPTPALEDAVRRAGERGVSVRILTNSIRSNNHLSAHSAYRNHIRELIGHGAELHEIRVDARDRHRFMLPPIDSKSLALHAKVLIIDQDRVFIGSANLDPRSLRINTEMGLLVTGEALNRAIREDLTADFDPANAWRLELREDNAIFWVSEDEERDTQPAGSVMQDLADWFFAKMPIEDEL